MTEINKARQVASAAMAAPQRALRSPNAVRRLTKYELPFNLKTAKALGVSRSPTR